MNTMRQIRLYTLLSLLCIAAHTGLTFAQTHYVGISPKLGYSALIDSKFSTNTLDGFNLKTQGGVIAGLSTFYELEKDAFHFQSGIDFDFINSTSRLTDYTIDARMISPYDMTYHYGFNGWKETRNSFFIQMPVLFGAQYGKFFFFVGPKVGIPVVSGYSSHGALQVTGTHDKLPADLVDIYTHEMTTTSSDRYKGKLFLKPTVSLAFEAGIDLDRWLATPPPRRKRGQARRKRTFKELLHYRASVFADYGFLNVNNYSKNSAYAADYTFPYGGTDGDAGRVPVFNEKDSKLASVNSTLGSTGAENMKVNPLTIGVKFTIMYEFEKPIPPKRTPKPKPKPKPKPQAKPEPKYYLCGVIENKETLARLSDAVVEIYDETGENSLYTTNMSADQYSFDSKLEAGTYMAYIRKTGYLPYAGTFTFTKDTVHFAIQEIKEKVVTLLDVHFATNKTIVLPESAQVLEDLYDFLSENPTVRIRITGHTDAIGSLEANQRLSEGRARSVTQEMIKRGIDKDRLEYEGKGELEPIATNDTEEGRALNRRVEFVILSK